MKPSKNESEYSIRPVRLKRIPAWVPSGTMASMLPTATAAPVPGTVPGTWMAADGFWAQRWFTSGTRLGVNSVHTTSSVCAPNATDPRAPETPRNSVSITFRKSRGANLSVGVTMSALPQRMNCFRGRW